MKLLLLPGFDGSGVLFSRLLAQLPTWIEPTVVSYPKTGAQSYTRFTQHLLSSLPTTPYVILGESFGGPLSFLLAEQANKNLRAIILSASFIRNPRPVLTRLVKPVLRPHHFKEGVTPAWYIRQLLLNGVDDNRMVKSIQEATRDLPAQVYYERLLAIVETDVSPQVVKILQPVLYLCAQHDRVVPKSAMQELLMVRNDIQVRLFDAPHMILQTQAEKAANEIVQFVIAINEDNR